MNKPFGSVVYGILSAALDLRDRVERGDSPELESEQRKLEEMLRADGQVRSQLDYWGDGGAFLGARYALACWIDELFIVHTDSAWSERWKERILEVALFGTRERAWKFWEQLDIVLKRPNTPRLTAVPGGDALETFFLCVALGFRGKNLDNPSKVREYVEEIRPQLSKNRPWDAPREVPVTTNVEPLTGKETLRRVVTVYGGITLIVLLVLTVLGRFMLG
jgi:type VI secretion system protein ImpK